MSGLRKHDTMSRVVAGAAFGDCLENLRKPRKKYYFWSFACENSFIRKTRIKSSILSFKRVKENSKKSRTKCSLWRFKMGGHFRVLRGRRNTLETCQYQRVVFTWQAEHFVTWRMRFFCESQCRGSANMTHMTQCQKSWQAQHFVSALKSGGSFAKFIFFELGKNSFIRKTRIKSSILSLKSVKTGGSLARNAREVL